MQPHAGSETLATAILPVAECMSIVETLTRAGRSIASLRLKQNVITLPSVALMSAPRTFNLTTTRNRQTYSITI